MSGDPTVLPLRRVFSDALVSTAAVGALLLVLVAADERVRDQVHQLGTVNASTALTQTGGQLRRALGIVMETARDQGLDHTSLLIFVLVATVLLLAMTRT
jgi:hypothetical protein